MPKVEEMRNILVQWGLLSQVMELNAEGFAIDDAIRYVYIAHARRG